jgi:hypothetical protein
MEQADVPQGRHGKHSRIVATILRDLGLLKNGSAIKIPLTDLAESKEKVRSALNRATRKTGLTVATASDFSFLYVWNVSPPRKPAKRESMNPSRLRSLWLHSLRN